MSVVLSYLTMKGGVGKTTLAANVTRAMADLASPKPDGAPTKFLLIDADAQCNLSQIFFTPKELESHAPRSIYQVFGSGQSVPGARMLVPGDIKTTLYTNKQTNSIIDLIPGSFDTFQLAFAQSSIQTRAKQYFGHFIEAARKEYDYIVIDTNPSATFTTLQALEVSQFLVSPITFDTFAMRGIDLIIRTLRDRYQWLDNPRRILVVPNKIQRATGTALERQEADEDHVRATFPRLEGSISISRIHESRFLDNRIGRRGTGFVIDQRILPMHRSHLDSVAGDFTNVARALTASIKEAFDLEAQNQTNPARALARTFATYLDRTLGRHSPT
ncbi:MAG: ParA family protein [Anaerolineae bacterium]|nr:ParA family protein [Anaerolineae bacterium]